MVAILVKPADEMMARFGNMLGALSRTDGRKAMVRAVNRVTDSVHSRVIRAIAKQSSIPTAMVRSAVRKQRASVRSGPIQGAVIAKGTPVSLKHFGARQLSYGVRAKVQGEWRKYPSAFMGPRPGVIAPRLAGHVFARLSSSRLPIERLFGPSVPEEMIVGESRRAFEETVATMLPERVSHEIGRLLPG